MVDLGFPSADLADMFPSAHHRFFSVFLKYSGFQRPEMDTSLLET